MTRTPAWKAARAERRFNERLRLDELRRAKAVAIDAQIRKDPSLPAMMAILAAIEYAAPTGTKLVYVNGEPRDAEEFAREVRE